MTTAELYIISDLHLCDGSRVEDFQAADERALVSFLFHVGRSPTSSLIINGDFVDFVQIQPRPHIWHSPTLGGTEADSVEKLEAAFGAHGPVFDALSRFVATGHTLRFQFGNHDIDLVWPQVQARLRSRLAPKALHHAITFGRAWHERGVYVMHGHQADPANSFQNEPDVLHPDGDGVLRLERCWGTRLVEEFYNKIEVLDGCEMLDNVRPRMQAAVIIIKHAIGDRQMHATLRAGLQVIIDTLEQLRTEDDVKHAADQLGISRQILSWVVSVAGWLGVGGRSHYVAKGTPVLPVTVPSLQTAYNYGASVRDGAHLAQHAPLGTLAAKSMAAERSPALNEYHALNNQRAIQCAATIATRHSDIQALCFGHTHQAITPALAIDQQPGWPLPGTAARLYNAGAWTRTLDLKYVNPAQATFEYIMQPGHYRLGRDYLKITWSDHDQRPLVETLAWGTH